jgi:subtilisin family serine protease
MLTRLSSFAIKAVVQVIVLAGLMACSPSADQASPATANSATSNRAEVPPSYAEILAQIKAEPDNEKKLALENQADLALEKSVAPGSRELIIKLKPLPSTDKQTSALQAASSAMTSMGFDVVSTAAFPAAKSTESKSASSTIYSDTGKAIGQAASQEGLQIHLVNITDDKLNLRQAMKRLMDSGLVEYAEPNHLKRLYQAATPPNDPSYLAQWYLKNTGQSGGTVGADINAEAAWGVRSQASDVVVAVIDDGVYGTHPDLQANMWVNPGEIPGNGLDDDGDGVADNINGADFRGATTLSSGPRGPNPASCKGNSSHGTWVAGSIGAVANNSVGIASIARNVKILAINADFDSAANVTLCATTGVSIGTFASIASTAWLVRKKNQAVNPTNIRVINMSYGSTSFNAAERDSIVQAGNNGILVVAAAGNDGNSVQNYPAAYALPNLIAVGASDRNDNRSTFSSFGFWVDVFAPGTAILTTEGPSSYGSVNGTSFASPIVAGAAALLVSSEPNLTPAQVKARIRQTAVAKPSLSGLSILGSRIDVHRMLTNNTTGTCGAGGLLPLVFSTTNPVYYSGGRYIVEAFACSQTQVDAVVDNGVPANLRDDGVYPDLAAGDGLHAGFVTAPVTSALRDMSAKLVSRFESGAPVENNQETLKLHPAGHYQISSQVNPSAWVPFNAATSVRLTALEGVVDANIQSVAPFPLSFGGLMTTQIAITDNGRVCVGDAARDVGFSSSNTCEDFSSEPIPVSKNSGQRFAFFAPWWNDWDTRPNPASANPTSRVWTQIVPASAGSGRKFVIAWENVRDWNMTLQATEVSFQIVFDESAPSRVMMNYLDVINATSAGGIKGSIGVQLPNGTMGSRFLFNQALLSNGTSITLDFTSNVFGDVPATEFFASSATALKGSSITSGCGAGTDYCPSDNTTRGQMAAFLMRGKRGHDLVASPAYPTSSSQSFTDVPANHPFFRYIQAMRSDGITTGCTATTYCPDAEVTRAQMAVFIVRALRGSTYVPPAATGQFGDVTVAGNFFAPFIEEMARMGVTSGCGNGNYCPNDNVTRGQMAAFLQRAFRPFDANRD